MLGFGDDEDGDSEDLMMPPGAIQLTWEEGGQGMVYVYDTETGMASADNTSSLLLHPATTHTDTAMGLVIPWKQWGDPTDSPNYFHVPALSPREAFQPLITKFRTLEFLGTPPFMEFTDNLFTEYGRAAPSDWDEGAKVQYRADHDVWEAKRILADLYLECGWDIETVEQISFRREEFIARREKHRKYIVEPLEEVASRVGAERNEERSEFGREL